MELRRMVIRSDASGAFRPKPVPVDAFANARSMVGTLGQTASPPRHLDNSPWTPGHGRVHSMQAPWVPFECGEAGHHAIEFLASGDDVHGTAAGRVHACTAAQPDGALGAFAEPERAQAHA